MSLHQVLTQGSQYQDISPFHFILTSQLGLYSVQYIRSTVFDIVEDEGVVTNFLNWSSAHFSSKIMKSG